MPGALGGGQGFVWNLGDLGAKKELHPLLISIPMKFKPTSGVGQGSYQ